MIVTIGDLTVDTENCGMPVVLSFRADELHNLIMGILKNPDLAQVSIFPPGYEKVNGAGSKQEFLNSVPVPETPECTRSALKFLRKAAAAKYLGEGFKYGVETAERKITEIELGGDLDLGGL